MTLSSSSMSAALFARPTEDRQDVPPRLALAAAGSGLLASPHPHGVRPLLRALRSASVHRRGRAHRLRELAGAGAPRGRARVPYGVGRRASLPGGVLALLGARGVP